MKPSLLLMLALVMSAALLPRGAAAQPSVTGQHIIWICATLVAVDPERNLVYATGCPTVEVIDGGSNTVVATVWVGQWPVDVAVNPATNLIYVAKSAKEGSSIWVIDGTTKMVVATVPVGLSPLGVAVNPTTNLIYVVNWGSNNVSVIDGGSNTVAATVPVGQWPVGVAVNPTSNLIYVANAPPSGTVSVIDGGTNTVVASVPVGSTPLGVAVNPTTNLIYVVNRDSNDVSVIDGGSNTVAATIPVGFAPHRVAVNPTTNHVYVTGYTNVAVIDGATNSLVATIPAGRYTWGAVAANPITSLVYVGVWEGGGGGGVLSSLQVIDDSPGAAPPPAASPTPVPAPTPTACPPARAPPPGDGTEHIPLQCGRCNPVATTYPDNTPIGTIADSVAPPGELESLWELEGGVWMGWSLRFPGASDLTQVDRLDVVFICVGGSAAFTRPVI